MSSNPVAPPTSSDVELQGAEPVQLTDARHDSPQSAIRRADLLLGPTGPFRPLLERYMTIAATTIYQRRPLTQIRGSIALFFRYVVLVEGINDLEQIRPSTITRFIDAERARGIRNHLFLGRLSTFFLWLISEGLYDRGNPVINRIHRPLMLAPPASSVNSH